MSAVEEMLWKMLRNPRLLLLQGDVRLTRGFAEAARRRYECELMVVSDGEEAIDMVETHDLEAVFIDVGAPGAFRFTAWFAEHHPSTPVVLIASSETWEIAQPFLTLGMSGMALAPLAENDFERLFAHCRVRVKARASTYVPQVRSASVVAAH